MSSGDGTSYPIFFRGSGSTLIATEKTGRRSFAWVKEQLSQRALEDVRQTVLIQLARPVLITVLRAWPASQHRSATNAVLANMVVKALRSLHIRPNI